MSVNRPLDELLSIAERAYVRMQAGQLISQCLEQGDAAPFNGLVEQLVLAGAPSLAVLREIHDEISSMRSTLRQEGMAVRQHLKEAFAGFGLHMPQLLSLDPPETFRNICGPGLRNAVRAVARAMTAEDQALLDELCVEAGERVSAIASRLALLGRLHGSVEDWLVCLAYEAAHEAEPPERGLRARPVQ
jgi:hypothetical protein